MSTWDYGSEDSPEHRFHRPVDNNAMHFRAVTPDPQVDRSPYCPSCGEEDCPGAPTVAGVCPIPKRPYTAPVDTGWGLPEPGMEPDRAEERIEDGRGGWL